MGSGTMVACSAAIIVGITIILIDMYCVTTRYWVRPTPHRFRGVDGHPDRDVELRDFSMSPSGKPWRALAACAVLIISVVPWKIARNF